eukprot:6481963-Amphidinium_carterae.2
MGFGPELAQRLGVHTVWADGSGRHSSNPHFRRCGVGYYTDAGVSVCMPLPGLKQFAIGRNSWLMSLHALRAGREQPKGKHRDAESTKLRIRPE